MSGIPHRDMTPELVGGRALFIPTSARLHKQRPVGFCATIVTAEGEICGTPFFSLDEKVRHVSACARAHASAIHAYRQRTHPEIMQSWDPELEGWMAKHKDGIMSGRVRV